MLKADQAVAGRVATRNKFQRKYKFQPLKSSQSSWQNPLVHVAENFIGVVKSGSTRGRASGEKGTQPDATLPFLHLAPTHLEVIAIWPSLRYVWNVQ